MLSCKKRNKEPLLKVESVGNGLKSFCMHIMENRLHFYWIYPTDLDYQDSLKKVTIVIMMTSVSDRYRMCNLSSTDRMILYPFHSCRRVIRRPAIPSLCPGRGWPVHPRGRNKSGTEQDVPGRVHVPVHCYSAVRTFMHPHGKILLHGLPTDGA